MELFAKPVSYHYLGQRDYVHGSSMLRSMLLAMGEATKREISPSRIKQFRVIKEFSSNARVECGRTEEIRGHKNAKDAVARLDLEIDDNRYTALLVPRPDSHVEDRNSEYDAADYVVGIELKENGESYASLQHINDVIDLLRGVVEGFRQILIEEASAKNETIKKMRWGYVTNFWIEKYKDLEPRTEVKYSPRALFPENTQRFVVRDFSLLGETKKQDSNICFYQEIG